MVRSGITRIVWLIGPYAIKIPNPRYGWGKFLYGLLSNMTERRFSTVAEKFRLAPVIWSMWGGWLNVQRRCEPIIDEEFEALNEDDWIPCDFKRENFGKLNGRILLLDYGELT